MPRKKRLTDDQTTLFQDGEVPNSYRKPVQVIHSMPRSPLSLVQRKLANAWMKNATESVPDKDGMWTINTALMSNAIGFDSNNRAHLVDSARALMSIAFEWDVISSDSKKEQIWKASVLFPEVEIRPETIRYQISRHVVEQVLTPEMYALIDLNVLKRFRRASSLGIYEHCVRFERIKRTSEVEWNLFRDILMGEGSDAKSYKEYKVFKDKVLKPAIAEVNSVSDIRIELKEIKIGRRVHAVSFNIERVKPDLVDLVDDEISLQLVGEMISLGISQAEANKLSRKFKKEEISAALKYTKKRLSDKKAAKLENPAAYFRRALSDSWAASDAVVTDKVSVQSKAQGSSPDIASMYEVERIKEASKYFDEQNPEGRQSLIDEYNCSDIAPSLKIKRSKPGKAVQSRFFSWLAMKIWGHPTPEDLLKFAQKIFDNKFTI